MNFKQIVITVVIIFLIMTFSRNLNKYAVDFIENQKEREDGLLVGAEPFKIEKNRDTTVLLVHGTGSSPKDFVDLANFMAKNKFLLGYSLGGILSLKISENQDLSGIISINAPIFLQSKYIPFIPLLELVQKYHVKSPDNIILAAKEQRIAYDATPLNAILEIMEVIKSLNLEKVTEPALIIQTKNDTIVEPRSADFIYDSISSKNKKIEWLELSSHTQLNKKEQEIMFEEIVEFVNKNSKP